MHELSEQEEFWTGDFGNEYIYRNSLDRLLGPATAMWAQILQYCLEPPRSAFEMGCNIGANLYALKNLLPEISLTAVEINSQAANLAKNTQATIYNCSIYDFEYPADSFDLVFSSGVLIHIDPNFISDIYKKIYALSNRYTLINEYYNPTAVSLTYRNHKNKLFKRDFAGEMLDMFHDLRLVTYRFMYHRDAVFPKGDTTWFLLEKSKVA